MCKMWKEYYLSSFINYERQCVGCNKIQTFLTTFLWRCPAPNFMKIWHGLYASSKTDSRTTVVSTQSVHFLISKDCLIITKISNMKNSILWLLFTPFSVQTKYILIAFYKMVLDTKLGNFTRHELARYSNVMKKCGLYRCHLTWPTRLSREIISKSTYFVLTSVGY